MIPLSWDQRIERARQLSGAYPFASECLSFYREICRFQKELYGNLIANGDPRVQTDPQVSFSRGLETWRFLPWFPRLLDLVRKVGPAKVAQAADALAREDSSGWQTLLESCWNSPGPADAEAYESRFFARALLQPYAEFLAAHTGVSSVSGPGHEGNTCSWCRHKPQMAVLRPEGYGARRSLVCSLCMTEWPWRRILCPACGEQQSDRLSVYTASQFEHVRVEACETCHTYIKAIDLTKDGRAIPIVDELATTPLDLWAGEQKYRKLERNLFGL